MADPDDTPAAATGGTHSRGRPVVLMTIHDPETLDGVLLLCDRLRALLAGAGAEVVVCDVAALTDPDLVTVEALARLQLTARRAGGRVELANASRPLRALLALVGLADVLPDHDRHAAPGQGLSCASGVRARESGSSPARSDDAAGPSPW